MNLSSKGCCFSRKLFSLLILGPVWGISFAGGFPAPVEVAAVEERLIAPVVWVSGVVVSRDDAQVAAEVEGRVVSVAGEGERVSRGDVVAELDSRLLEIALHEREAEAAREKAQLVFFEQEVERLERLARQNNAARTLLEETAAQRDATTHDLAAALVRVELAQERIDRSRITAPFDGVVVARLKREGEWLNRGDAVVHLLNDRRLEVQAAVSLALKPFVAPGQAVVVAAGEKEVDATVRIVTAVAQGPSRLLTIKLDLAAGSWLAGQPVRVALPSASPRRVVAIPRDAMVLRGGGVLVFRVKSDNTAEKLRVTTGAAQGDYIEVMGPLSVGDRVVVRGGERLRPGQQLRLIGAEQGAVQKGAAAANGWWSGGNKQSDNSAGEGASGGNPWWPGEKAESADEDSSDSSGWSSGDAWPNRQLANSSSSTSGE